MSSNRIPPKRSRDLCSLASHEPDVNPIENIWDMLCRRIQVRELPVQNIRQLEAAAITTGHPTSNWKDETQG